MQFCLKKSFFHHLKRDNELLSSISSVKILMINFQEFWRFRIVRVMDGRLLQSDTKGSKRESRTTVEGKRCYSHFLFVRSRSVASRWKTPPQIYIYLGQKSATCLVRWFCWGSADVRLLIRAAEHCAHSPSEPVLEARLYVDHVRTGRGRQISRENSPPVVYTLHK